MIRVALLALVVLAGCAGPRALENPNSVPNVLLSITQTRAEAHYIFMTGGLYDGAATGQTTRFVVTPDDHLICTFQTDPVFPGESDITVSAHRLIVPGIYAQLASVVIPNVVPLQIEYTTNFTVEVGTPNGPVSTTTGFGDPRFTLLFSVFNATPTPCWAFG